MKHIARHAVDRDLCEETFEGELKLLEQALQNARTKPSSLGLVESSARRAAACRSVLDPASRDICRYTRIAAGATVAMMNLASEPSGEVEVDVGDGTAVRLPATGPTSEANVARWLSGFYMAAVVRDPRLPWQLTAVEIDVLRRSSTKGDDCMYLFVAALQKLWQKEEGASTLLLAAVEATNPTRLTGLSDAEFVLNILVQEMEVLYRLMLGEPRPFNDKLCAALELHKKYWSKAARKRVPDGYLAPGLLAFAGMAHDAGIPVEVESDYLPKWLYEGGCRG
jgi:hypothetical protein